VTSQCESSTLVSPIKAPALMILDVYGAEGRSCLSLLGMSRASVLDPRNIVTFACVLAVCILAHQMTIRHLILYLLSLNPFGVSRALLCTFESSRSPVAIRHGQLAASVPIQGYGSLIVTAGNN